MAARFNHHQVPMRKWCRNHKFVIGVGVAVLLIASILWYYRFAIRDQMEWDDPSVYNTWVYQGQFDWVLNSADQMVIRDGGFNCCVTEQPAVIADIRDPAKIAELRANLKFKSSQIADACMCCGYPRIDWYSGNRPLALTAIQHAAAVRWRGFPGDAVLTNESAAWLYGWMIQQGVNSSHQLYGNPPSVKLDP